MERNNELVSIVVLSYNSETTIIDTLDSIKNQSYENLQLVISDDCSKDNTIKLVKKWLVENDSRFTNVDLLTVDTNTGISANYNRGLKACKGEWIKAIAADDILLKDCVRNCVIYLNSNDEIKWIVGKTIKFTDSFDEDNMMQEDSLYSDKRIADLNSSVDMQQIAILRYNFIEAPAVFINKGIIYEVGGCNEKYKLLDDWPLYKKLLFAGYKCYFLNELIVGYRQSDNSVFNLKSKLFNINYIKSLHLFIKAELYPCHSKKYRYNKELHYYLCRSFEFLHLNKPHQINRLLFYLANKLIDFTFKPI